MAQDSTQCFEIALSIILSVYVGKPADHGFDSANIKFLAFHEGVATFDLPSPYPALLRVKLALDCLSYEVRLEISSSLYEKHAEISTSCSSGLDIAKFKIPLQIGF